MPKLKLLSHDHFFSWFVVGSKIQASIPTKERSRSAWRVAVQAKPNYVIAMWRVAH